MNEKTEKTKRQKDKKMEINRVVYLDTKRCEEKKRHRESHTDYGQKKSKWKNFRQTNLGWDDSQPGWRLCRLLKLEHSPYLPAIIILQNSTTPLFIIPS
jgi:hypothetical protein